MATQIKNERRALRSGGRERGQADAFAVANRGGRLAYLVRVPAERPRIGWRELVLLDTDRTTQHGLGEELDEAGRVVFRSFYELGPASRYFAATREEYELLVTLCDQNDSELGVESEDVDWSGFVGFVGFDADEDSL